MSIRETVRGFVLENFYVSEEARLADDASLIDEGIVDSTGMMELIWFIEEHYRFKVGDQEAIPANLETIERITRFVSSKVERRPVQPTRREPPPLDELEAT